MKIIDLNKKEWQWAALLFLAFVWGSSFILMKRGLEVFTPVQVASMRMMIAGIVFLPFVIRDFRYIKQRPWALLVVGLVGNGIPAYLFTWSQMHVTSSIAGILNSVTPVFTLIAGGLLFRSAIARYQIAGVVLGFAGSVLLFMNRSFNFDYSTFGWGLLIVLATAMYGTNINHVKYNLKEVPGLSISALSFFLILPFISLVFFADMPSAAVIQNEHFTTAALSVLLLGIFGSAIAVAVINILIKHTSPVFASTVTYLMPAVALLWGYSDNEAIGASSFLALALILAGVYLAQLKNKSHEHE
jgi:drug/metabolite transporter (DMT)-like permease